MSEGVILEGLMDGTDLALDPETISFRYRESLYGSAVYRLHVRSDRWEVWNRLVSENTKLNFRLRWSVQTQTGATPSSWKRVVANRIKFTYTPTTVAAVIHGTCAGAVLGERCHANAFIDVRVSEMVERLAKQNGLTFRIQPTSGKHTDYQGATPDGQFIRNRLLPLAMDTGGLGGYYFWIENGERLVFEPIKGAKGNVAGKFSLLQPTDEASNQTIGQLSVSYDRMMDPYRRCGRLDTWGFDVLGKSGTKWTASADTTPHQKLAGSAVETPGVVTRVEPMAFPEVGESPPGSLQDRSMGRWSMNAQSLFRTRLHIPPSPEISPGQFVQLLVQNPAGEDHFSTGLWLVYATEFFAGVGVTGSRVAGSRLWLERRNFS